MEFEDYLNDVLDLGKRTVKLYLFYYKHLQSYQINSVMDLQSFIIKHSNTSAVRGMVKNYLEMEGVDEETIKKVMPPRTKGKKEKKLIRRITQEEIKRLKSYFYAKGMKHGLIFDLIYQGALRRVEVTTIKIGSFRWVEWFNDPERMCKLLIYGKGKRHRIVLINPETAERILHKLLPKIERLEQIEELELSNKLLLTKKDGKPLTDFNIYTIIKRGSIDVLGRDIRPHELRHNRATELEQRGVQIRDIKNYLGHSRISTTEIYLHKTGEESIESIEKNLVN